MGKQLGPLMVFKLFLFYVVICVYVCLYVGLCMCEHWPLCTHIALLPPGGWCSELCFQGQRMYANTVYSFH